MADQGIFSGANFGFNILLARRLESAEYGSFAIAFSILLFAAGFHNALVLEPMSVIGPVRYGDTISGYLRGSLRLHSVVAVCLAFLSGATIIFLILLQHPMTETFVGLAVGMPLMLTFWFVRRACYLELKPKNAIKGSAAYAVALFSGVYLAHFLELRITSASAFILMGIASASVSLWMWFSKAILAMGHSRVTVPKDLLPYHWNYGKWAVGSAFVHWSATTIYLPFVGALDGLSQAGGFRALQNLFLPLQQSFTALGTLILPWIARRRATQGIGSVKRTVLTLLPLSLVVTSLYCLLLLIAGPRLLPILYGSYKYNGFVWLVPYLSFTVLVTTVNTLLSIGLKALELPRAVFLAQAVGSMFTLTLGLLAVYFFGLGGAAAALMAASLTTAVALTLFARKPYTSS
jgi:O-antigen/teichoic acid export membrane protein